MYQLPLRFIKVSPEVAICATRVIAIMSTDSYQARRTIKDEKTKGTLINGSGIKKSETALFLDNGAVVSSPYKLDRLLKAIEDSNIKKLQNKDAYNKRLTVYEIADEEPNENDEEVDAVSVCCELLNEEGEESNESD